MDADEVIVTGVYAAREEQPLGFTLEQVLAAIQSPHALAIQDLNEVAAHLLENLTRGDILIVFSAGDATIVSADVFHGLQAKEAAR